MKSNIVIFGSLGHEPELVYTIDQKPICRLSLAETIETNETVWHNVVLFGREAELCKATFSKGHKIFVFGRIKINSWTDKDKNSKKRTEVLANQIGTIFFNKTIPYTNG